MAIDIEALKKRLAQLSGTSKKDGTPNVWWRPGLGDHRVRVVPYRDNNGQPFKEIWYYKGIGVPNAKGYGPFPMQTRAQYKQPDPIQEFIDALRKEDRDRGTEENKPLLKKLYPKLTFIVPIIVRGEEDKGVRLWAITDQGLYQKLLGYFFDSEILEDTADWTDPVQGFDLKVKVTRNANGKIFNGKPVKEIDVEIAKKISELSKDPKQAEKWLNGIPDINIVDPVPTYDEAKSRLEEWLSAGAGNESSSSNDERGSDATDNDIDKLEAVANEVNKPEPKPESSKSSDDESSPKPKKEKKRVEKVINDSEEELQKMFDDLENGD